MAIAFRSSRTTYLDPASTSVDIAMPSGIQPGDGLIISVLYTGGGTISNHPSWIRAFYRSHDTSLTLSHYVSGDSIIFWRVADGTEAASYNFTLSASGRVNAVVTAYSGTSPAFLGRINNLGEISTTAITPPSITHNLNNSQLFSIVGSRPTADGATYTTSDPLDAERADSAPTVTAGTRPTLAVYDSNRDIPVGTVSSRTFTASTAVSTSTNGAWLAELISNQVTGTGPISFVGSSYTSSTNSVVATTPAGVQPGDLLIAAVWNSGTVTAPTGFSKIQKEVWGSTNGILSIYYRLVTASEPSYNFTISPTTGYIQISTVAYRGVNTSSPIGNFNIYVPGSTAAVQTIPAIQQSANGSWLVYGYAGVTQARTAVANDPLDAERIENTFQNGSVFVYDSNRPDAFSSRTITQSGTNTNPVAFAFELRSGTTPTVIIAVPAQVNVQARVGAFVQYVTGVSTNISMNATAGTITFAVIGPPSTITIAAEAGSFGKYIDIPKAVIYANAVAGSYPLFLSASASITVDAPAGTTSTAAIFVLEPGTISISAGTGGPVIPINVAIIPPLPAPYIPPVYSFVLCDPVTGEEIEELSDATNRTINIKLKDASEARFRLSIYSEQAALISSLGSGLKVYRDDFLVFRGIVGPTAGSIGEGNKHDLEYVAIDYRGALKRYHLWTEDDVVKTGFVDDAESIAWRYISTVQSRLPSLNIVRGSGGAVGISSFWRAEAGDDVQSAINKLSDSANGFDWDIIDVEGRMTFTAWPVRGVDNPFTLDPGGSVLTCNYTFAPEQYANVVRVLGAGGVTATAYGDSLNFSPIGVWGMHVSDDSLKTTDMVNSRAAGILKDVETFTPTYAVTLSTKYWSPEQLWIGDSLIVDILPNRRDKVRVSEISLDIDGGEKISVTLGHILPNFITRAAEAYERTGKNQNAIAQKAKTFIQDDEPMSAGVGDLWTPLAEL